MPMVKDFYANVASEAASIAITVLVIERLNARRTQEERKRALVAQLGSRSNDFALEAARLLQIEGWGFKNDTALQNANLRNANLRDVDLRGANLQKAELGESNLQDADLRFTRLLDANLGHADLQGAELRSTNLQYAALFRANLQDATLNGANLQHAALTKANLQAASLVLASLQNAHLNGAEFNEQTTLPDGTNWTPETDMERFTDPKHPDFWEPPERE